MIKINSDGNVVLYDNIAGQTQSQFEIEFSELWKVNITGKMLVNIVRSHYESKRFPNRNIQDELMLAGLRLLTNFLESERTK